MLRRATLEDVDALAAILRAAMRGAMPWLPDLHTPEDDRRFLRGTELINRAKERRPAGFRLWVFQKNEGARRFYVRHGLHLVELTDGSGNEEKEPDALYEWRANAL